MLVEFTFHKIILWSILSIVVIMLVLMGFSLFENHYQQRLLGAANQHPADIYASRQAANYLISPFSTGVQPMQRLLLIDFQNNPDEIYRSFELQSFNDSVSGTGLLVIAYRNDSKIDLYTQVGLVPNANYDMVAGGLADRLDGSLKEARFEVNENFAVAGFSFTDKLGRDVKVFLQENFEKARSPFSLLAPLGSGSQSPVSLPLFLMYDFSLARQVNTQLSILIDGKSIIPDDLPLLMDGDRVYLSRYSSHPVIINWAPSVDNKTIKPVSPSTDNTFEDETLIYDLVANAGFHEIKSIRPKAVAENIRLEFYPPFPDISALKENQRINGEFTFWLDPSVGRIDGHYQINSSQKHVSIQMQPDGGWQPATLNPWVRLLFLFQPMFQNWPKSYIWNAEIDFDDPSAPLMFSQWSKIK